MYRGFGLRCPHCGGGALFKHWIGFNEQCGQCGFKYYRDSGDFWGAVVGTYAMAGTMGISSAVVMIHYTDLHIQAITPLAALTTLAVILLIFPFNKSLWIHFLYLTRGFYEEYKPPEQQEPGA